ncbi:hypothetical protein Gotri_026245 [Gossypium trilobum]|uniref:Uncharacterized protein n=1 Tax=Gossypium trilobum TaxID=34281 RepID=A0A7J9FK48_9ROSI|nr:hypothetical protein [Gossypium trilobum]
MQPSGYGLRRYKKRRVTAWWRDICHQCDSK